MSTRGAFAWHSKCLKVELMELHLSAVSQEFDWVYWSHICYLFYNTSSKSSSSSYLLLGNGVLWLEVYRFPVEAWLKELDMVKAQEKVLKFDWLFAFYRNVYFKIIVYLKNIFCKTEWNFTIKCHKILGLSLCPGLAEYICLFCLLPSFLPSSSDWKAFPHWILWNFHTLLYL